MAKKKKEAHDHVVSVEDHMPIEMTSEMIDHHVPVEEIKEDQPKPESKIESDLAKHSKFSKFRGEK